ncbi:MAG: cytochrome c3 family protein [Hyphomonadaceae bacterium]|nr:cytochrome c3 family protein [Hyphomonadaceae bacterium]
MTATLRFVTRRANGRETVRTVETASNLLAVGRAPECDIHLPDLRVALRHAQITVVSGGFVIDASGDNVFSVNRRSVRKLEGRLGAPAAAQFGPYTLTFSEAAGRLVIDIERVQQTAAAAAPDADAVFSLKSTWLSKRAASWAAALLVGAVFLAFPLASYTMKPNAVAPAARIQAGQLWLSGELSDPHKLLAGDCSACHEAAFVSVRDETCVGCHEDTAHHAKPDRMTLARGAPSMVQRGLRTVADTFNKPAGRCAECHAEHNGADGVAPADAQSCTTCHDGMQARLPDAAVHDASDFGRDHPEFRPTLVAVADPKAPTLTRQWTVPDLDRARKEREALLKPPAGAAACDGFAAGQPNFRGLPHPGAGAGLPESARAGDDSGLVFPHDVHLAKDGCVASLAQRLDAGFGDQLACADCHTPTESGAGFLPVSMEKSCASCHSLVFETVGGLTRTLPHGQTNAVIATLLDFYQARVVGAALGGEGAEDRRRPGAAAQRTAGFREAAFAQASGRAAARVRAVFAEGGACYGCHEITPPTAPERLDFAVAPVTLRDTFLPKGVFDHGAHEIGDLACADCHAAETSRTSADVLVPSIAGCQDCHGGEHAMAKVQSSCVMCHGFHAEDPAAPKLGPTRALREARLFAPAPHPARSLFREVATR